MSSAVSFVSEKSLGILLFSTVLLLSISGNVGLFNKQNWIFEAPKSRDGSTGDFVIKGKSKMFTDGKWKSTTSSSLASNPSDTHDCEIRIVNNLDKILYVCWIDFKGKLHNFYPVNDCSINDASVSNTHDEITTTGHAFVCLLSCDNRPKMLKDVCDEVSSLIILYFIDK